MATTTIKDHRGGSAVTVAVSSMPWEVYWSTCCSKPVEPNPSNKFLEDSLTPQRLLGDAHADWRRRMIAISFFPKEYLMYIQVD